MLRCSFSRCPRSSVECRSAAGMFLWAPVPRRSLSAMRLWSSETVVGQSFVCTRREAPPHIPTNLRVQVHRDARFVDGTVCTGESIVAFTVGLKIQAQWTSNSNQIKILYWFASRGCYGKLRLFLEPPSILLLEASRAALHRYTWRVLEWCTGVFLSGLCMFMFKVLRCVFHFRWYCTAHRSSHKLLYGILTQHRRAVRSLFEPLLLSVMWRLIRIPSLEPHMASHCALDTTRFG